MVALNYDDFGNFIGSETPYAQPHNVSIPPPDNANIAVLPNLSVPPPVGPIIRDHTTYVWDFRHAFPWDHDLGDVTRALKVQNYRIVKAILVPYTYDRKIESTWGGVYSDTDLAPDTGSTGPSGAVHSIPARNYVFLKVNAHLLIGYTALGPPTTEYPRSSSVQPAASPTPYQALGEFIRLQTPQLANLTNLVLDAEEGNRTTLEIGESWLAKIGARSAATGGPRLKSTSDNEMDVLQEQQCFYWDFDLDIVSGGPSPWGTVFGSGAMPAPPTPYKYPPPPPLNSDGYSWLRNWQVTKGIRAVYHAQIPDDPENPTGPRHTVQGEILVGFTGGGGM